MNTFTTKIENITVKFNICDFLERKWLTIVMGQCYKTLIYCRFTVISSFCVIKRCFNCIYSGGMEVNYSSILKLRNEKAKINAIIYYSILL